MTTPNITTTFSNWTVTSTQYATAQPQPAANFMSFNMH